MGSYDKKVWDFFKSKNLNDFAIAGLMGNLYAESGINPINLQNTFNKKFNLTDEEYVNKVDDGTYTNFIKDSAGFGMAQWTYWTRKQKLYNYCKENNKSIGDIDAQLDFLYKELSTGYTAVWKVLLNATSVKEASDVVLLKFEKPTNQSESVQKARASYGQKYYDSYAEKKSVEKKGGNVMKDYSKYIYSTGTHYIANSGGDEKGGTRGGQAGDQTGKEWQLKSWYSRPWSVVLRYEKDPRVGILMANLSCAAALNNKIGYDQAQRVTYWTQLKKVGYNPENITVACEEDCTAGVTANTKACGALLGISALENLSTSIYSKTMRSHFVKAGFTALTDKKYLSSSKYLLPGDVLLYEGHHAAANVTVGSSVKSSYTAADISNVKFDGTAAVAAETTPTTTPIEIKIDGNAIGTAKAKQNMHIRDNSATSGSSLGIVKEGETVEVYEILSNGWMKVKYGEIVGYTSNRNNAYFDYAAAGDNSYAAIVVGGRLNVRKGPGANYGVKKVISEGDKVTVYKEENGFGQIDKENNLWCSLKFLKKA